MKLSGALPVHNEERLMPYMLNALADSKLDELCAVFDRCTDNSYQVLMNWIDHCNPPFTVKWKVKEDSAWKCPLAEAFQQAFEMCTGDIIYTLAADLVFGPDVFNAEHFLNSDLVTFGFMDIGFRGSYEYVLNRVAVRLIGETAIREGIFGVKKSVWGAIGGFRDVGLHFDIVFVHEVKRNYKFSHKNTKIVHLRPTISKDNVLTTMTTKRAARRALRETPFYRVLLHSCLHLNPLMFVYWYKYKNALHKVT